MFDWSHWSGRFRGQYSRKFAWPLPVLERVFDTLFSVLHSRKEVNENINHVHLYILTSVSTLKNGVYVLFIGTWINRCTMVCFWWVWNLNKINNFSTLHKVHQKGRYDLQSREDTSCVLLTGTAPLIYDERLSPAWKTSLLVEKNKTWSTPI